MHLKDTALKKCSGSTINYIIQDKVSGTPGAEDDSYQG